jgi:hypothetical protein
METVETMKLPWITYPPNSLDLRVVEKSIQLFLRKVLHGKSIHDVSVVKRHFNLVGGITILCRIQKARSMIARVVLRMELDDELSWNGFGRTFLQLSMLTTKGWTFSSLHPVIVTQDEQYTEDTERSSNKRLHFDFTGSVYE